MHSLTIPKNDKEGENQERKEKLLAIVQCYRLKNPYWPLMTSKKYKNIDITRI